MTRCERRRETRHRDTTWGMLESIPRFLILRKVMHRPALYRPFVQVIFFLKSEKSEKCEKIKMAKMTDLRNDPLRAGRSYALHHILMFGEGTLIPQ